MCNQLDPIRTKGSQLAYERNELLASIERGEGDIEVSKARLEEIAAELREIVLVERVGRKLSGKR